MSGRLRAFCKNCGADLVADEPVTIDDWSMMGDGYPLCYRRRPIRLTPSEASFCWSLLKAFPDFVTASTLLDRTDSDGEKGTVTVLICRIRRKLKQMGIENPIETVHRLGYRWRYGGNHELADEENSCDIVPICGAAPFPADPL